MANTSDDGIHYPQSEMALKSRYDGVFFGRPKKNHDPKRRVNSKIVTDTQMEKRSRQREY